MGPLLSLPMPVTLPEMFRFKIRFVFILKAKKGVAVKYCLVESDTINFKLASALFHMQQMNYLKLI